MLVLLLAVSQSNKRAFPVEGTKLDGRKNANLASEF